MIMLSCTSIFNVRLLKFWILIRSRMCVVHIYEYSYWNQLPCIYFVISYDMYTFSILCILIFSFDSSSFTRLHVCFALPAIVGKRAKGNYWVRELTSCLRALLCVSFHHAFYHSPATAMFTWLGVLSYVDHGCMGMSRT